MAGAYDPVQQAFETAMREFRSSLKNEDLYRQILQTTSIEQVYDATDQIQKEQAKKGHLRHLSKINVYLNRLKEYAGAVEVFVQVKPDILALIWGPIKLLLQWANVLKQSFDAIVNSLEEIGMLLPEFTEMMRIFGDNTRINELTVLFFKDILDFYLITLKFFSSSRLTIVFEMLWPSLREKIKMVGECIKQDALLIRSEVQVEEIRQAHDFRRRAQQHFLLAEKASMQQEYASIRTHVSPKSYDDDLDRLHGNICEGTGKWLFRDKTFLEWLQPSQSVSKVMWLKGIPGSGKTFLAATIISQTKSLKQKGLARSATLFAFLSYKESSHTTALSIINSLIFQLADNSETLKAALCQASRENMRSSLDVAAGILRSLLRCAGLVYLVVDGIDEIEEMERSRLLKQLLQLSNNCDECRILLSSRSESDIAAILQGNTVSIEVHNRNAGSIQAYVNHRMAQWFQERSFIPEFQTEIQGSLAPLAHTAKGMFLYARVVFAIIWDIDRADELRSLLKCPPASLNDAYGRIFDKINRSTNGLLKAKARRILGWVGCAPSPLTRREIEHALLVNPEDTEGEFRVVSVLDVVRVCGPIVEVVDDYVQFVHFTAKEFIFHGQTSDHIALSDATLSLTHCCLAYLCQGHHDPDLSEEDISSNLLSGAYRFHNFASIFWFELLKQFLVLNGTKALPDDLKDSLESMYDERSASGYQASTEGQSTGAVFDSLDPELDHLQQMLNKVSEFRKATSNADYHLRQESRWIHLDPLTTSLTSISIYNQLDHLLCSTVHDERGCPCPTIQHHYGPRAFKCGFLRCQSHRHGFEARSIQSSHEKHHEQPWICDVPGCKYSSTGFLTRKWRDYHLQIDHRPGGHAKNDTPDDPDKDELQPLLFDLVGIDNVEAVRALLHRFNNLPGEVKDELSIQAAALGSSSMLDLLKPNVWGSRRIHYYDSRYLRFCLSLSTAAIEAENVNSSTWLVAKIQAHASARDWASGRLDYQEIVASVITSESKEMYDVWKGTIFSLAVRKFGNEKLGVCLTGKKTIAATNNDAVREQTLLLFWREKGFLERLGSQVLGDVLANVASTTCSINLARVVLDAGANINKKAKKTDPTPLHYAARKTTEQAARFMEFLLYHGANPDNTSKNGKLENEKGVKQISKWMGISWNDLVEKTKTERVQHK